MRQALTLAALGIGRVEPNPAVGAVIVDDNLQLLGQGYHEEFGGPHAEAGALAEAGAYAKGATLYVTLEPCAHHGKTPPCADAIIQAGLQRVVIAMQDPFPKVDGRGIDLLKKAGIAVEVGLLENEARRLTAPFRKLTETGLPYVHAKWAMTLDGRIATASGDSKWITSEESRVRGHRLRGRMDAILVGCGTVLADDPLLTARVGAPVRKATRIVFDSHAKIPLDSQLVTTAKDTPVLVIASARADRAKVDQLRQKEVEVLQLASDPSENRAAAVQNVLEELGRRRMTNVLVEGGGQLLGSFFDAEQVDEAHVFMGPRIIGSADARSPVCGEGRRWIADAAEFELLSHERIGDDVYLKYVSRPGSDFE
ncbi:bifunctional diaminohydroxyphosphoribosylaminopyrimidine deaminase/5-amino-6-(5-phosphoribosylamino)uracil reductase RibD [Caulifigura coniformis]|nr:bifunctional diaminohydroxyphosphoribosylaminopyrimidine deaminase/5-amino-6-(5-phosphoribosylamino)uracil reductase RibD [Caulifigura coniformis]